eukprot:COSAG01_NODE_1042_length_11958_cov_10.203558_4_plen_270_part_00
MRASATTTVRQLQVLLVGQLQHQNIRWAGGALSSRFLARRRWLSGTGGGGGGGRRTRGPQAIDSTGLSTSPHAGGAHATIHPPADHARGLPRDHMPKGRGPADVSSGVTGGRGGGGPAATGGVLGGLLAEATAASDQIKTARTHEQLDGACLRVRHALDRALEAGVTHGGEHEQNVAAAAVERQMIQSAASAIHSLALSSHELSVEEIEKMSGWPHSQHLHSLVQFLEQRAISACGAADDEGQGGEPTRPPRHAQLSKTKTLARAALLI